MAQLEDLTRGAQVRGIRTDGPVEVLDVKWHGTSVVELTYKGPDGRPGNELLFRDREPSLEVTTRGPAYAFDADGDLFRLVSEAYRIRLAYLFDPLLAVHTSLVQPLPHQILAVYQEMVPRQPLRFLLADDPGAGKTIMAGLLIKELIARGDLKRVLVVTPGSLAEQWQDEMSEKFQIPFEILTSDKLEAARTGNWFRENDLVIARLDKLSRNEDVQAKLEQTDWDLVIVDEAHKMSASFFSGEVKETKRYKLGKLLGRLTRHFLLMTATPHNGKEEDFQLFLALLDADRFEGRFRDGVHVIDPSDLMRRLVKEALLKFDGTPLFPERRAYTANYRLSDAEALLYKEVTDYVREEFNRADALEEGRKGTIGFALTILQRRLASSPEAIYQSLKRRHQRLERRLAEEELLRRGGQARIELPPALPGLTQDDIEELEDAPESELEEAEEQIVDQATAARTVAELQAEIAILKGLEELAFKVRHSGTDRKWEELRSLLQNQGEMFDQHGHRRKLVIFTEHRDTLNYLADRIRSLIGRPEAVVTIHGSVGREDRRKAQERFTQHKDVEILVATDAAGEGINLQRAHLMVNYDLPWNPNRIEQRFGRIHRIGQPEVCHLWNLLAEETREGDVFKRVLDKIEQQRAALGDGVFDILPRLFQNRPLRELLIEAIRYGDQPEVKARLFQAVDNLADRQRCQDLLEERALARDSMDAAAVRKIREDMERAEARRLQPHFVASFFLEAFRRLGGSAHEREAKRYEVTRVPAPVRSRDRQIGRGNPVLDRYERITFEKDLISIPGQPLASFVCPGHPLLDATIDIVLERYRDLFKRGATLVDPNDPGDDVRVLSYLEHSITDARRDSAGNPRVVSRQVHFVESNQEGVTALAGWAPYLDYRPLALDERALLKDVLEDGWLKDDLEARAVSHAVSSLVPQHLSEVRGRREELVEKTRQAVKDRLMKEINYWDHRANDLKAQELAGKTPRLNSGKARQRADELEARLSKRLTDLEQERHLSALPPVVVGGALIVPKGLLLRLGGQTGPEFEESRETARIEALAMQAVMETERRLGFEPRDVGAEKCGYDIESRVPGTGKLRFIEVKGRHVNGKTITVTKNEILTALNKPDDFWLAVVLVDGDRPEDPHYIRRPFTREPDFGVTSVNYEVAELLAKGQDRSLARKGW
ncbi:MAG TPA: helicase-related protein [Vicinamibacteria bacterium]|nr:helicase-related protein [Vicinamibacteria bacterium]